MALEDRTPMNILTDLPGELHEALKTTEGESLETVIAEITWLKTPLTEGHVPPAEEMVPDMDEAKKLAAVMFEKINALVSQFESDHENFDLECNNDEKLRDAVEATFVAKELTLENLGIIEKSEGNIPENYPDWMREHADHVRLNALELRTHYLETNPSIAAVAKLTVEGVRKMIAPTEAEIEAKREDLMRSLEKAKAACDSLLLELNKEEEALKAYCDLMGIENSQASTEG